MARAPFETLYDTYRPFLRKQAILKFRVPSTDADDLVHDVFTTFLSRRSEINDPHAYLLGAICNASRKYWRDDKSAGASPLTDACAASTREAVHDDVARAVMLGATLSRLGATCRDTLYRFHVLGERASAIAASRAKKENYIFRLLNYCRNRAKEIYEGLNDAA
jgi:DNA-directed RNA polymerase specialized sigma24 family protein